MTLSPSDICKSLGHQLVKFDDVISILNKPENFIPYIQAQPWGDTSLSHGYPGLICMLSELHYSFPNEPWNEHLHSCIGRLANAISANGIPNQSLFSGSAGICYSILLASQVTNDYHKLREKLHTFLLNKVDTDYLETFRNNPQFPISPFFYDHIAGITGILSYLLNFKTDARTFETISSLLRILISMTQPIIKESCSIPGWFIPSEMLFRQEHQNLYPNGCFDTGLAHGISGCLAILSKAAICGIDIPDLKLAIKTIANWMINAQCKIGDLEKIWPGRFGFNSKSTNHLEILSDYYRDGWCYGSPGIAMSLLLAGSALKDRFIYEQSINIMLEVCNRFPQKCGLQCPSFCHGLSGLLAISHQFYLASHDEHFATLSKQLVTSIINKYDEELPLGFKCFASVPRENDILIDNAGLLDGASGIILSLLFYRSRFPRPWLPIFLLY